MDNAEASFLHVSQNVPINSPMEVTMKNPINSQIHISQVFVTFGSTLCICKMYLAISLFITLSTYTLRVDMIMNQ